MAWTALSVYIASTIMLGIGFIQSWILEMDLMCRFAAPHGQTLSKKLSSVGWDNLTDEEGEKSGVQLQLGNFGKHDILGSVTYDKSVMKLMNDYRCCRRR